MQIIEVKNNLVKISYSTTQLVLSGFVSIADKEQSFIGQIINLDANKNGKYAIAKLLFNFNDDGVITNYNGSIPALDCSVTAIESSELLGLLPAKTPIYFGELAQQSTDFNLDISIFDNKLLVCCDKFDDKNLLINNLSVQLHDCNKKLVVIDAQGDFDLLEDKIVAEQNFKLPLNYETINFIYNEIEDASQEVKAMIQDVFLEVQDYVKTLPEKYLPFETFKNVVDAQCEELQLVQLVLLKNKLLKFSEEGVFAQNNEEIESLKLSLESEEPTIFDISKADGGVQKELISYVYSLMKDLGKDFYVVLNIDNENSSKKLLKQVFTTKNVNSIIVAPYSYKYLTELKQLSKNTIMFAPIQQQNDFGIYNVFVNKLNPQEYVIYGFATHHIPFVVKAEMIKLVEDEPSLEHKTENVDVISDDLQENSLVEEVLDEEIKHDVDEIYSSPKNVNPEETFEEELTEDDLDFIESMDIVENSQNQSGIDTEDIPNILNQEEETLVDEAENFSEMMDMHSIQRVDDMKQVEEEEIIPLSEAPALEILPSSMSSTPIVPIYSADDIPQKEISFNQGDTVTHPKYGKGIIEKLINYGSKTLCSINFDNVGRRLLDPNLAELTKV